MRGFCAGSCACARRRPSIVWNCSMLGCSEWSNPRMVGRTSDVAIVDVTVGDIVQQYLDGWYGRRKHKTWVAANEVQNWRKHIGVPTYPYHGIAVQLHVYPHNPLSFSDVASASAADLARCSVSTRASAVAAFSGSPCPSAIAGRSSYVSRTAITLGACPSSSVLERRGCSPPRVETSELEAFSHLMKRTHARANNSVYLSDMNPLLADRNRTRVFTRKGSASSEFKSS
jgi:hypothetical protein